ncbi:hypothetical protein ABC304_09645 [Microbacterium sp. 1P10UB]
MVPRSRALLQQWVDEFVADHPSSSSSQVALQDELDGADAGLVIVPLLNAATTVYIQPIDVGEARWQVTFEARSEPVQLVSERVRALAAELVLAADLCAFLEARSAARDHERTVGAGE